MSEISHSPGRSHGHNHGEALCLMWYACTCGHQERIWNSRDGVTPFGASCPSCGNGNLTHVRWREDKYSPDHKLVRGQRFWRDGTPDEAEAIMRRRIEKMRDKYPITDEDFKTLIADSRAGIDQRTGQPNEFRKGWPMLDMYNG